MPEEPSRKVPDTTGFWSWFADHNQEILDIVAGRREGKVTEVLDAALEQHGLQLSYDVTESILGGELTFSPEGDAEVARFIDGFVAASPSFDTWIIHARRQRKSLGAALAFVKALHGVDIASARFKVRYKNDRFHLCFLHDQLAALDEQRRYAVAATFLDHALGEDLATEFVGQLEFRPAGDGIEMALVVNQIICDAERLLDTTADKTEAIEMPPQENA